MQSRLDLYIQAVERFPRIGKEEEWRLFARLHASHEPNIEELLISSHLRYVVNIARGYLKYEQPFPDLIQEGNIGLVKAVRQFKPERGNRLISSAIRQINLEICRFVLDNWCIATTGITKEQLHLFMRMQHFRLSREPLSADEIRAISSSLGVRVMDIQHLEDRLRGDDLSLSSARLIVHRHYFLCANLADGNDDVAAIEELNWNQRRMHRLKTALAMLDERSRDVIERRWLSMGKKAGFREISKNYKLSGERIRQIQQRAFSAMRRIVS